MPRPTAAIKLGFYADNLKRHFFKSPIQIQQPRCYPAHIPNQHQTKDNQHGLPATTSPVPKDIGVFLYTSLSFNKHCDNVAERVSSRNNMLKALAGTSWGQQKETLLMTYKAVGIPITNNDAHAWSTNLSDSDHRSIQYTQNDTLGMATGCYEMSSTDHLHTEVEKLNVNKHSELLSAQCLFRCIEQSMSTIISPQGITLRDGWRRLNLSDISRL